MHDNYVITVHLYSTGGWLHCIIGMCCRENWPDYSDQSASEHEAAMWKSATDRHTHKWRRKLIHLYTIRLPKLIVSMTNSALNLSQIMLTLLPTNH